MRCDVEAAKFTQSTQRNTAHLRFVGFSITSVYVSVRQWHRDLRGHYRVQAI